MSGSMRIRLLASVAVVGRDNEPMYLLGDLFDVHKFDVLGITSGGGSIKSNESNAVVVVTEDEWEGGRDGAAIDRPDNDDDDDDEKGDGGLRSSSGSPPWGARGGGGGLFGRIKGVVGGGGRKNNDNNNNQREDSRGGGANGDIVDIGDGEDDDDDDDPFGFFTNASGSNPISHRRKGGKRQSSSFPPPSSSSNASSPNSTAVMSLTEQLVLHASLDKFEEMSCKSSAGGSGAGDRGPLQQAGHVRWRGPGMNSPNSMYMGLLCRVEERWDVYGYLTNTGIKFMMVLENVCTNTMVTPTPLVRDDYYPSFQSSTWSDGGINREADLKKIFARLHDLYVKHTMNPFSQLRSTIKSRRFDDGVIDMARSFNDIALEHIASMSATLDDRGYGEGMRMTKNDGVAWM